MAFEYKRMITDDEERLLRDSVLDPKGWIDKAIEGKISNCSGHLSNRRRKELIEKGDKMIPAIESDLAISAFADKNYKSRLERDLEQKRKEKV